MKKVLALFGALFVFVGVKAQTPTIKKETVMPVQKPTVPLDSLQIVKPGSTPIKQNTKAIKFDHIKKAPTVQMKDAPVQMKEAPAAAKPHKG